MQCQLPAAFPGWMRKQSPGETQPKRSCDPISQVHPKEGAGQIQASGASADAACTAPCSAESITRSTCHFPAQEVTGDGGCSQ